MPSRKELLKDFYSKYSPETQLTEERLTAIDNKYGDDNKALLTDFYSKYAPEVELTDERFEAISKKYSLASGGGDMGKQQGSTEPSEQSQDTTTTPSSETPLEQDSIKISNVVGGEVKNTPSYTINGEQVSKDVLSEKINNADWLEDVRLGNTNVSITDDDELTSSFQSAIETPANKKIKSVSEKIAENDDSILNILGRSLTSGTEKLIASTYRTPEFLYDIAANGYNKMLEAQDYLLGDYIGESKKIPTSDEISDIIGVDNVPARDLELMAAANDKINEKYRAPIYENIKSGNYADASLNTAMSITESLPFMAGVLIPSAMGVNATKMFATVAAPMGAQRKQELLDRDDMSETQKNANALIYGMAEATDVFLGAGAAGRAVKTVLSESGEKTAKEFGSKIIDDLIIQNPALTPLSEGFQEAMTTYIQNVGDVVTGENKNKDVTEGVADSFIVGAVMGGGQASVVQTAKLAKRVSKGANKENIEDINSIRTEEDLNEITSVISEMESNGDITPEDAKSYIDNISEAVNANIQIPQEIKGEDRVNAIKLQIKYDNVLAAQNEASKPFKGLYNAELSKIEGDINKLVGLEDSPKNKQNKDGNEQIKNFGQPTEQPTETSTTSKTDNAEAQQEITPEQEVKEQQGGEMRVESKPQEPKGEDVKEEIESVAKVSGVKAKNIKGLYDINRKMFSQNRVKSLASAVVMDRAIGQMAKRAGITKDEMYSKVKFKKGDKAPDGSLKQESPIWESTAKKGVEAIQQKAATPEQWVKMITDKGGKGTSQELDWIGLQDYLSEWKKENNSKSVPKEVVEQYIADNQIEIIEVSKGRATKSDKFDIQYNNGVFTVTRNGIEEKSFTDEFLANNYIANQQLEKENKESKYSQYTLEGGENYREVLLTLPVKNVFDRNQLKITKNRQSQTQGTYSVSYKGETILDGYDLFLGNRELSESEIKAIAERVYREGDKFNNKENMDGAYRSSHWDESNILAHLRINERTLPNGERVMFIEEVQSDWAQEGKKKGFKGELNELNIKEYNKKKKELDVLTDKLITDAASKGKKYSAGKLRVATESVASKYVDANELKKFKELSREVYDLQFKLENKIGVPDMPYKKTDQWVGMAMRRVFKMAADEGFDRVAWVTGEQSAERYSLKEKVNSISVQPNESGRFVFIDMKGNYNVTLNVDDSGKITEDENNLSGEQSFTGKQLEDVVGKDMADKILSQTEESKFEGDGLEVGGEGMKAFYNSILPNVAKKEAQRFDKKAKVEVVGIDMTEKNKTRPNDTFVNGVSQENNPWATSILQVGGVDSYTLTNEILDRIKEKVAKDKANGVYSRNELSKNEELVKSLTVGDKISFEKQTVTSDQLSIAITPEMRMNLNSAVPLFQGEQGAMLAEDGNYIIYALTNPNVSTPLHELAHVYEHYLNDTERKQILSWAGKSKWDTGVSERFARGFERYLASGKAPDSRLQKIFDKFKEWLTEIYNGIKGSDIDIELNNEMKSIYDKMLGGNETKLQDGKKEEIKIGDTVKVTKDTYKSGKRVSTTQQAEVTSINDDGTYNLKKGNLVYKNIKPTKINKFTPSKTVESETEGLTYKETVKQGVTELVNSYKGKIKQIKDGMASDVKAAKDNAKDKANAVKEARKSLDTFIKESLPKSISLPKGLVRKIQNANTDRAVENAINDIEDYMERASISEAKRTAIKAKAKAAKKLRTTSEFTNKEKLISDLLSSLNISDINDSNILDEINTLLDDINTKPISKIREQKVKALIDKLDVDEDVAVKKGVDIDESISSALDKGKSIKQRAMSLAAAVKGVESLEDGGSRSQLEGIEKAKNELNEDAKDEVAALNRDSESMLENADVSELSEPQKDMVERLKKSKKRADYRHAKMLNDIAIELSFGYAPIKNIQKYLTDAISEDLSNDVSTKIDDNQKKRKTPLQEALRKGFFGVAIPDLFRLKGIDNRSIEDVLRKLGMNDITRWDDFFGLGKTKPLQKAVISPIEKAITAANEGMRKRFSSMRKIKNISPEQGRKMVMAMVQGAWNLDVDSRDYWGELLNDEKFKSQNKKRWEQLKKDYDSMPKDKNGNLDYDSYLRNLKGNEKALYEWMVDNNKKMSDLQRTSNERRGQKYKEVDNRYYVPMIGKGSPTSYMDGDSYVENLIKMIETNAPKLESDRGKERTSKEIRDLALDPYALITDQVYQTMRDYHVTEEVRTAIKTMGKIKSRVKDLDASKYLSAMYGELGARLKEEFSNKSNGLNLFNAPLNFLYQYTLSGARLAPELLAEATRMAGAVNAKYIPLALKLRSAFGVSNEGLSIILDYTNSPFASSMYFENMETRGKTTAKRQGVIGTVKEYNQKILSMPDAATFNIAWSPRFLEAFKAESGKDFDVDAFKKNPEKYLKENDSFVNKAASIADADTQSLKGAKTKFGRRRLVKVLPDVLTILPSKIATKQTGKEIKFGAVSSSSSLGKLVTTLQNFAFMEQANIWENANAFLTGGENKSMSKASNELMASLLAGTLYTWGVNMIYALRMDDKDEREDEVNRLTSPEGLMDSVISNVTFLMSAQFGNVGKTGFLLAIGMYDSILKKNLSKSEYKKQHKELQEWTRSRYYADPIELGGYKSDSDILNALMPFVGRGLNIVGKSVKSVNDEVSAISKGDADAKAVSRLISDLLKLFLISTGTAIPFQKEIDKELKKTDKEKKKALRM
jgi:hypothetical protein